MPADPHDANPISWAEQVKTVIGHIQAARTLDQLFLDLHQEILRLFDAQEMILYAFDPNKHQLVSRFPRDTIHIVNVPISKQNLAGYAAISRRVIYVQDAYDQEELHAIHPSLAPDASWDKKTGFRTRQVLTFPILSSRNSVFGVIQLLNKQSGGVFTKEDEAAVAEIGGYVGAAFVRLIESPSESLTYLEYLETTGLLTPSQVTALKTSAHAAQADLESLIIDTYKIPASAVTRTLGEYFQCPSMEYDERLLLDPALFKNLKMDFLKKSFWVPIRREGHVIDVLVDNPRDLDKVQVIKRILQKETVHFFVGLRRDILKFVQRAMSEDLRDEGSLQEILGELVSEAQEEHEELESIDLTEHDSAIVRLTHRIITEAYRLGASDIHIEPYAERQETEIRFRVDGTCFDFMKIPASYRRAIVSRLKIMSGLDIAEHRRPQDGKIRFRLPDDKEIELRVALIPTVGRANEDIVIRILTGSVTLALDNMDFSERNLHELLNIVQKPYGIIVCVGPTGSGKTTALHAVLGHINRPERKIWTAEDPVEITQHRLRQVQVQPKIGFTFAAAMRAFLRADPDVIMIGEMRDKETTDIALEASLTGHLVFSTLHTNNAVETVTRLLDLGCDSFALADALLGILAQRLCKRLCRDCKEEYRPSQNEYDALAESYGIHAWQAKELPYDKNFKLFRGKGCHSCNHSGFKGRIAIHELLVGNPRMKRLIQSGAKTDDLLMVACEEGMTTLVQDGIEKVLQGHTTYSQVMAVAIK